MVAVDQPLALAGQASRPGCRRPADRPRAGARGECAARRVRPAARAAHRARVVAFAAVRHRAVPRLVRRRATGLAAPHDVDRLSAVRRGRRHTAGAGARDLARGGRPAGGLRGRHRQQPGRTVLSGKCGRLPPARPPRTAPDEVHGADSTFTAVRSAPRRIHPVRPGAAAGRRHRAPRRHRHRRAGAAGRLPATRDADDVRPAGQRRQAGTVGRGAHPAARCLQRTHDGARVGRAALLG